MQQRRSYQQALLEAATGALLIAALVAGAELGSWHKVRPMDVIIAAGWAATLVVVAALYLEDRPSDAP